VPLPSQSERHAEDLAKVPTLRQRQDSLTDQMKTVVAAAERLGCYDAADWLRDRWAEQGGQR
jgi:hypothetical protein